MDWRVIIQPINIILKIMYDYIHGITTKKTKILRICKGITLQNLIQRL